MNTQFPYEKIDYMSYIQRYFQREDAIRALPDEEELRQLAHKAIVKEHLSLSVQPEGTKAEPGDTLTIATVSDLPKFNKPRTTVSLGRGLYHKVLEQALVGLTVGESCHIVINDMPVAATVLEIKRKIVPQPTDEMVVAMDAKDSFGNPLRTVAEYEAYVITDKRRSLEAEVNYYVNEMIIQDHPIESFDEEDIRVLGDLERVAFHRFFLEKEGIDLYQLSKEEMQERFECDSYDAFIDARYDWYKIKIHHCLIFGKVLGIPLEGRYDPLTRYEVLSDLTMLMFDKIEEILTGGTENG